MNSFLQSVPFAVILLIVGFLFLVKGADAFVEGSSSIAKHFHVPSLIIGMTIVAMGTSLPETAVSVTAAIAGSNALAVSNAVGSNIFNLMVVIGVCAALTPVAVQKSTLKIDFPFSVFCAFLLLVLGRNRMVLTRVNGLILIVLFVFFLLYMIRSAQHSKNSESSELTEETAEMKVLSVPKSLLFIVLGIAAITFGSDWVVDGAKTIAAAFGISENLIGLTVVAFGTSLPELMTSIVAARKNEVDMALGNAIGSNIFNILMVLGIAAALNPITFIRENIIDIIVLIGFSFIVWIMAWTRRRLSKPEGLAMILLYAGYVVYICMR
ncbi:calcium/sodium antiporter [Anaerosacchariphilus sp. NSJ-68]|uniref:Calcium/sodium antiporter n=2 Tax=Lachnospiraceae TaxID=186803 RepID=A0A923RNG7_9FIRM|nr:MULTISPECIES: calcium/sodium antiporter [Lachnospiraceae]MBC5659365.1 calcium/sodium antiporter [Anaerosacchariphilus hominis]MBC5697031.1 calcium/sodium antiporter [Roseburia difficilis]